MKRKSILVSSVLAVCIMSFAFTTIQQPKPWPVPDKDAKMPNPVKSNAESISAGKALWNMHCSSCHGKKRFGRWQQGGPVKNNATGYDPGIVSIRV